MNKKFLIIVSSTGLVVILSIFILYSLFRFPSDSDYIARINNEPVTVKEFRQQLLLERGEVLSYFRSVHNAQDEANFWTNSYGGEIPLKVVKDRTLDEMKKIKIQLLLAQQEGFIKEISYEAIIKEMKAENKKRKEAIEKNQVVLGQREYTEKTYEYYLMSEISKELKEKFSSQWNISEEELRKYYDGVKNIFYLKEKSAKIEDWSYTPYDDVKNNLRQRWIDQKYVDYINELAKIAKIQVYEKVYEKFKI